MCRSWEDILQRRLDDSPGACGRHPACLSSAGGEEAAFTSTAARSEPHITNQITAGREIIARK